MNYEKDFGENMVALIYFETLKCKIYKAHLNTVAQISKVTRTFQKN